MLNTDGRIPIDHPIVNYYINEMANGMPFCDDSDCDLCDYEAS